MRTIKWYMVVGFNKKYATEEKAKNHKKLKIL
ncbi:MAG: hypothetical protein Sylvanvirus9_19 [Sylvanvirus sp.]|uniref:Uncharacterized protein n=1 Tax=Sylvanvirus sp. TaxID=2487774 RepID=A0A3G5ALE3_9VIRU|nr:MAG: hypothetical protein Sylvanvirus9_19 [Sylvanvirus sp.]